MEVAACVLVFVVTCLLSSSAGSCSNTPNPTLPELFLILALSAAIANAILSTHRRGCFSVRFDSCSAVAVGYSSCLFCACALKCDSALNLAVLWPVMCLCSLPFLLFSWCCRWRPSHQSLPFGGVKDSGYGRFAGPEGLRACCLLKSVTVDRFPKIMGTVVPAPLQVPNPVAVAVAVVCCTRALVELYRCLLLWQCRSVL